MIEIVQVSKIYYTVGRYFGGHRNRVVAVDDVSLSIPDGRVVGLVGESGSGKSTLARLVMGLEKPTAGEIIISGVRLDSLGTRGLRDVRRNIQIVFQNPYTSLDPLMTLGDSIEEPLINLTSMGKPERTQRVFQLLDDVELPTRMVRSYPHQLSGGERQRACIARALAIRPKIVVCDEPVSSLDKSIQAQILNLLLDLKIRHGLTYLFISHDLGVINHLCDQVAVMHQGRIVEQGAREDVLFHASHPYTQSLMEAAKYFTKGV